MYAKTETGGALIGAIGAGGMQGDSVMPDQFTEGCNKGIEEWADETDNWQNKFECTGATDAHET